MSILTNELYMKTNLRNLPYNGSNYIMTHIFIVNEFSNTVSLYKLNANSSGSTNHVSINSNYGFNTVLQLFSGVTSTFLFDVDFLFPHITNSVYQSAHGCSSFSDPTEDEHVFSWFYNQDGVDTVWYLLHNGIRLNRGGNHLEWYVYRLSTSTYDAHGEGSSFTPYYSLGPAQSRVISDYVNAGYPNSNGSGNNHQSYNNFIHNYLICLGSEEICCLETC